MGNVKGNSNDMNSTRNNETRGQVKRLLRRKSTREFFTDHGWCADPEEATNFSDALEAAQQVARLDIKDVELTLRVEVHGCDVFCVSLR